MLQVNQLQIETKQLRSRRCLVPTTGMKRCAGTAATPVTSCRVAPIPRCPASGPPLRWALPAPVLLPGEEKLFFVCLKAIPRKGWRLMYFPLSEELTNKCCFPAPCHSQRLEPLWKAALYRGAQRHSQARAGKHQQGDKGAPEDLIFITGDLGLHPGEVIWKSLCSSHQCL